MCAYGEFESVLPRPSERTPAGVFVPFPAMPQFIADSTPSLPTLDFFRRGCLFSCEQVFPSLVREVTLRVSRLGRPRKGTSMS